MQRISSKKIGPSEWSAVFDWTTSSGEYHSVAATSRSSRLEAVRSAMQKAMIPKEVVRWATKAAGAGHGDLECVRH